MSLSAKEAAQIARKHGLTLSDAQALARLAEDEKEANELAAMFSDTEDDPGKLADRILRQ